jgi:nucleotide-binding universal stress UspA family protein
MRAMSPITHIVVPTDFSESAQQALDYAIDLSQKVGAKLSLVHVCEVPAYAFSLTTYVSAEFVSAIEEGAKKKFDETLADLKKRVPTAQGKLLSGPAGELIHAAVKELGGDLIVMGTHGRRGLGHVLLGSVAERTVRTAAVPVLVVHGSRAAQSA